MKTGTWKLPIAAVALTAIISGQRVGAEEQPRRTHAPQASESRTSPMRSETGISPRALDSLYSFYLDVQGSLARDDGEAARARSRAFLKGMPVMPPALSVSVEARDVRNDVQALAQAKDLAALRRAFSPFSDRMVALLSEARYRGKQPALAYFCPMANGNRGGKWLQAGKPTANPYFGSSMATCGTLEKTLHDGKGGEGVADGEGADHNAHH